MIEETTLPEAPALIVPPGYDPQPRRWRATWTRGYDTTALICGVIKPEELSAEGDTASSAVTDLIRHLCDRGVLRLHDERILELVELGLDDDIPEFWLVRIVREADGAWGFELMGRDL